VTWHYRAQVDPYQTIPGLPPVEGTATATVRAGRITVLALASAPESIERRTAALSAHSAAAMATQRGGATAPFVAPRPTSTPAPPGSADLGVPLAVAGLGAAAWALSVARGLGHSPHTRPCRPKSVAGSQMRHSPDARVPARS
jgi:hypothetical protein